MNALGDPIVSSVTSTPIFLSSLLCRSSCLKSGTGFVTSLSPDRFSAEFLDGLSVGKSSASLSPT